MTESTTNNSHAVSENASVSENCTDVAETREEARYETPCVDIHEIDNGLRLIAEMPGASSEGLDISLDDGVLTLKGKSAPTVLNGECVQSEFQPRVYYRQFKVSDAINPEAITAEIKDGLLTLELPRAEKAKPRKIQVGATA